MLIDLEDMLSLSPTAIQISQPLHLPVSSRVKIIRVIEPGMPVPGPQNTDAIIVDASQGKGKRYDPGYARDIMSRTDLPVILAGGLNPDNVAEAVRTIRPYAVDVASGTEISPGIKDPEKVRVFIQNARLSS
jgi:phosphoribosylanthranilate isomerase